MRLLMKGPASAGSFSFAAYLVEKLHFARKLMKSDAWWRLAVSP